MTHPVLLEVASSLLAAHRGALTDTQAQAVSDLFLVEGSRVLAADTDAVGAAMQRLRSISTADVRAAAIAYFGTPHSLARRDFASASDYAAFVVADLAG